jgi:hypothetical protein
MRGLMDGARGEDEMKRIWILIVCVGLLTAAIGIPACRSNSPERYTIAYKMDKGSTFTMQVAREHRNYRNFMGNELITNSEGQRGYGFTVKSSGDDGLRLEIELTNRVYHSDDANILMDPDFSELIGLKVAASLSSTGELSDLRGFDELPEIAIPGVDDRLNESQYINEAIFLFPRLSKEPVKLGDSWDDVVQYEEVIADTTLPLTVRYTYTLLEETDHDGLDCLKILGDYIFNMEGPVDFGGLDLDLALAGTGIDTVYFAWKKGMFVRSDSRVVVQGSADNEDMGVSIPMKHNIKMITTVSLD